MKEFNLFGRHNGATRKLVQVEDNKYQVETKWLSSDEDAPLRIGYEKDNTITFIDFDGGPFLQIGASLDPYSEEKGYYIESFGSINDPQILVTINKKENA